MALGVASLVEVLRSGILAVEKSNGSLVTYLLAMYTWRAETFSSQLVQWALLVASTAVAKFLLASLCAAFDGWPVMLGNLCASQLKWFFCFLISDSSGVHHLLEKGQGFLTGTCFVMVS